MRDYDNLVYYAIEASDDTVHTIVQDYGLKYVDRIGALDNFYLVSAEKKSSSLRKRNLLLDERVAWMEEQVPQRRLFKRAPPLTRAPLPTWPNVDLPPPDEIVKKLGIKDPGFTNQFHLFNHDEIGNDLNVTGVWYQGITGKNVTIVLLDDGIDYEHPDLKENFFAEGSWDFNLHTNLPKPLLFDDYHGTRCAGEISALKNDVCGVGIAYESKVGGIRILSGSLTIADEAAAITYMHHKNHIFSCSWGPRDDGATMEKPPKLAGEAFKKGIISGRDGKGTLFVFAAGNGGSSGDNCNFDGYTNSIYTITVGAIQKNNEHPSYSEPCAATLTVTYSGYGGGMSGIYTTDVHGKCTSEHGGTSAAAPMASGVLALVLSVRPDLTWRDVQALIIQGSVPVNLDDPGWQTVGNGRKFNHKFGYGKLDGYQIVKAAKKFKNLNLQTSFSSKPISVGKSIPENDQGLNSTYSVTSADLDSADLKNLEHITVNLDAKHSRRGDISLTLISPNGYVSELLTPRNLDMSTGGFDNWTTMSVKHWDENPVGTWTLQIKDSQINSFKGDWNSWSITLWGASSKPQILSPRSHNIITNSDDMLKNNPGGATPVEIHESIASIIFGTLCLVTIIFGAISAREFWKRVSKNKNRSSIANDDRYIPIEEELDDAFLESQLREMIDEDI